MESCVCIKHRLIYTIELACRKNIANGKNKLKTSSPPHNKIKRFMLCLLLIYCTVLDADKFESLSILIEGYICPTLPRLYSTKIMIYKRERNRTQKELSL